MKATIVWKQLIRYVKLFLIYLKTYECVMMGKYQCVSACVDLWKIPEQNRTLLKPGKPVHPTPPVSQVCPKVKRIV